MLNAALQALPLVAILRGVKPEEVEAIADALHGEGFRVIEVPLNSPNALDSIGRLARRLPADTVVGAGTVLSAQAVADVQAAGGKLIVMPHADVAVIREAKARGLFCVPGAATPTEAFAAVNAGGDARRAAARAAPAAGGRHRARHDGRLRQGRRCGFRPGLGAVQPRPLCCRGWPAGPSLRAGLARTLTKDRHEPIVGHGAAMGGLQHRSGRAVAAQA
jgi:hypothetical protein